MHANSLSGNADAKISGSNNKSATLKEDGDYLNMTLNPLYKSNLRGANAKEPFLTANPLYQTNGAEESDNPIYAESHVLEDNARASFLTANPLYETSCLSALGDPLSTEARMLEYATISLGAYESSPISPGVFTRPQREHEMQANYSYLAGEASSDAVPTTSRSLIRSSLYV